MYCDLWDADRYEQFKVDKTGIYEVVVDAKKYDAITYTITYKGDGNVEPEDPYFVKELYMFGPALSGDYDLSKKQAFTGEDGIFTWEGELSADVFRFQTQSADFIPALMMGAEEGRLVYVDSYDVAGVTPHLSVTSAGAYKIVVDGRDKDNLTYSITSVSAQEPMFNVTELYMLGGAADTGWDLMTMGAFTNNNGIYTWEGNLKPGGDNEQFRFPLQKVSGQWWPCLVPSADGKSVVLVEGDGVANDFRVEKDGKYKVTVNIYDGSLKVEYIGVREAPKVTITELYILGAATDTGWDLGSMAAFTNNGGVFSWTGNLKAGEQFRFPTQKVSNQWWPCLVIEDDGSRIFYGTADADNRNFTVSESGEYTITIDAKDISNLSYTIVKK